MRLKDFAIVRQAVQQSRCHAFALEDLAEVAERQVVGQRQAAVFITLCEDLKQQFRASHL